MRITLIISLWTYKYCEKGNNTDWNGIYSNFHYRPEKMCCFVFSLKTFSNTRTLKSFAWSTIEITVHYSEKCWPEGHHHHHCPALHAVKIGNNEEIFTFIYYDSAHMYVHLSFHSKNFTPKELIWGLFWVYLATFNIYHATRVSFLWSIKWRRIKFLYCVSFTTECTKTFCPHLDSVFCSVKIKSMWFKQNFELSRRFYLDKNIRLQDTK